MGYIALLILSLMDSPPSPQFAHQCVCLGESAVINSYV